MGFASTPNLTTSWMPSSPFDVDCEVGGLESWIPDDGTSRQMTSSTDSMTNYRECSGIVRIAGGEIIPIEAVGEIILHFCSD